MFNPFKAISNQVSKIKSLFKLKGMANDATEEITMEDGSTKPGWKTTEFWLTLAMGLPAIAKTFGGEDSLWYVGAALMATLAYNYQRGQIKQKFLDVAKSAIDKEAVK